MFVTSPFVGLEENSLEDAEKDAHSHYSRIVFYNSSDGHDDPPADNEYAKIGRWSLELLK